MGIDFMGPFPPSIGFVYILVAINYASKWVEALTTRTIDYKVVLKFVKEYIFCRYGTLKLLLVMEVVTFITGLLRLCLENILGLIK